MTLPNKFTFFFKFMLVDSKIYLSIIIHIIKCESSCATSTFTCWSLLLHFDKVSTTLVVELSSTAIVE